MSEQIYPSYLIHYGIEGQKWGVRRFQNEDGSLTEEGKKRYGISEKEANKLIELEKKDPAAFYKRLNKNKMYKQFRNKNEDLKRYESATMRKQMYADAQNIQANKEAKKAAHGYDLADAIFAGRDDLVIKYLDAGQAYMQKHAKEMQEEYAKYDKEKKKKKKAFEKAGEKFVKDLFGEHSNRELENPNSVSVDLKTGKVSKQTLSRRALIEMYRDKNGRMR